MIAADRFSALALKLEHTTAVPHVDRTAFRTPRKIFATLAPDGASANICLPTELQELLALGRPKVFAPLAGGWGKMGWTRIDFGAASEADANDALTAAHAAAAPPKKAASSSKPSSSQPSSSKSSKSSKKRK